MLLWLLSKLLFIKYLPSNFYQAPEQLVLRIVREGVSPGPGQGADRRAEQQRSEGWESLVNPVESAPPSEPLWNSSFQAS